MRLAMPLLLLSATAMAATPQQVWTQGIAAQNKDYAQIPHAMLKIQDSAYLGEGQAAVLTGRKADPASWHWRPQGDGPLKVTYRGGKLAATWNGKPVDSAVIAKSLAIDTDVDVAGQPTQVGAGVPGWRLFLYNQKAIAARDFKGVSYYPYDPAFRVTATFKPDPRLPPRVFRTSRGTDKQFFHAGDAAFALKGKTVTLPFYADSRDPRQITDMSAFFTDGLTGRGAYGAGRYNDVEGFGRFPPRRVTIDFNNSYNPNCARSAHFTCPVAVDAIPLDVTAGERDPHLAH